MKNIKFRAWNKKENKWVDYPIYIDGKGNIYWENYERGLQEANDIIIMQSTELVDKHGVEIYEGDVLFHPLQGRRKVYYPYRETVASYGLRNIDNGFGSTLQDSHAVWEVIGNIYEYNDLLEGLL